MRDLEKYRIFVPELRRSLHIAKYRNEQKSALVPELRRSLHIAKYRNEQKSARFHIVTYII